MSDGRLDPRASALFLALAEIPAGERDAWVAERCGGDAVLRRQIESLLSELDVPGDFLDPAALHPPPLDAASPLTPGTRLGDFTIQRVIGSGSAGIVYTALQDRPRRVVALKVLRRDLAASSVRRRFEVEAELLGQLQHPGIAQIFEAHGGDDTTPPFIAMELVDGPPITEFAGSAGLGVKRRVDLVARVCDAVEHAHQRGIIHRDLKPGNVLVGRDGQPKIVDFGVARPGGASVAITTIDTEAGQMVGTVPYMSPEQVLGLSGGIDTRSDVYALGVILFRLLTGRLPFAADDPPLPELARRIAQDEAPRLGRIDPSLGGDLEAIVGCALAKEKERRYSSTANLAADLRRWLDGWPVAVSADSAWYLVRKRLGRYRWALVASIAAAAALGVVTAYAVIQRSRAEHTNVRLADELSASNIERARLLGRTGNLLNAEAILWDELFRRPESRHARWALWEVYSKDPSIWAGIVHAGGTEVVAFDLDGQRLFTAGRDARVRILDAITGETQRTLEGHTGPVTSLAVLPSGRHVVSGARDGLRVWTRDGGLARVITLGAQGVTGIVPAGPAIVAVAAGDDRIRLVSTDDGRVVDAFESAGSQVRRVAWSTEQGTVAGGTQNGEVIVWDRATRRVRWRRKVHDNAVMALAFRPGSGALLSGSFDQQITMLDPATGRVLERLPVNNGTVRSLAFDPHGRRLAIAGWWRTPVWNIDQGRIEDGGVAQGSWDVDISPDGRLLAICDEAGGRVRVWDLAADARIAHSPAHHSRMVGIATAGAEPLVLTASADGALRWQNADTHELRFAEGPDRGIVGLAVAHSGADALVLGADGQLVAREIASGKRLANIPIAGPSAVTGRTADATALAVAPDADGVVLVGYRDGTLRSWDWNGTRFASGFEARSDEGEVLRVAVRGDSVGVAHRGGVVLLRKRTDDAAAARSCSASAPTAASSPVSSHRDCRSSWPSALTAASSLWARGRVSWSSGTGRRRSGVTC